MYIRRLAVKPPVEGKAQRVLPPPPEPARSGAWTFILTNLGAAAIELVDSPAKGAGEGMELKAEKSITIQCGADELYALVAAGEEALLVVGSNSPGGS